MHSNVLGQHRFSSEGWVDQACREQLGHFLPVLLEDLVRFRPRLAFLSGSGALGEAVGTSLPDGGPVVLSDLDLGVVTEFPVPPNHRLPAATSPVEIGVGLYLLDDLPRQEPTLGVVDLRRRGLPLWGEPDLLQQFPAVTPEDVPLSEAVRLIGNRSRELLQVSNPRSIFALHRWAKMVGALYTADSVLERRYETGWAARQASLEGRMGDRVINRLARDWIPFLRHPSLDDVPPRLPGLLREGLSEFFSRASVGGAGQEPHPAAAFLAIPTTFRQRLREWRREYPTIGVSRTVKFRLSSVPEYRRLGLAAAYWTFGPERPEPIWEKRPGSGAPSRGGNETKAGSGEGELLGSEVSGWREATGGLLGHPLDVGPGLRDQVHDIVEGAAL